MWWLPRDTPSPRDIPPSWTSTAIATNIRVRRKFQLHGHEPTDAVIVVVVVVIVRKIIRVRHSLVWHCHATHKVLWRLPKRAVVDIDMVVANIIANAVAIIPSQSFPACNLLCRKTALTTRPNTAANKFPYDSANHTHKENQVLVTYINAQLVTR
jgi:hypothetical protein